MGRINLRLDDKIELKIKKLAKENGMSISDYCREKITGENTVNIKEELNPVTIENRIEILEGKINKLAYEQLFLSRFIYHFMAFLKDKEFANASWKAAEEEFEKKFGSRSD